MMQRRRLMIDTEITPGYASWQTVGTYTFSVPFNMDIDVFLVGGGAGGSIPTVAGSGGGGGGGYTMTYKKSNISDSSYNSWIKDGEAISVKKDDIITISIGGGGGVRGNGIDTYITVNGSTYTANKGLASTPYYDGGDGGSGGGSNGGGGHGGSDGSHGVSAGGNTGGYSQGHTTYPFGELGDWITDLGLTKTDGDANIPLLSIPYSGGGGGGQNSGSGIAANGGWYGGGNGSATAGVGYGGTNGYGGGGGGTRTGGGQIVGIGGCGCVIIRWGI